MEKAKKKTGELAGAFFFGSWDVSVVGLFSPHPPSFLLRTPMLRIHFLHLPLSELTEVRRDKMGMPSYICRLFSFQTKRKKKKKKKKNRKHTTFRSSVSFSPLLRSPHPSFLDLPTTSTSASTSAKLSLSLLLLLLRSNQQQPTTTAGKVSLSQTPAFSQRLSLFFLKTKG